MEIPEAKQTYGTRALLKDLASFLAPYNTKFIMH